MKFLQDALKRLPPTRSRFMPAGTPKPAMNLTRWIIVGITVQTVTIDVLLAMWGGKRATLSVQITEWAHEQPMVAASLGGLITHFFAQDDIDFSKPGGA